MDMLRHIFEDPNCPTPDEVHPHLHAESNLGAAFLVMQEQQIEGGMRAGNRMSAKLAYLATGKVVSAVLRAAQIDPEWSNAILASYPADTAEIVRQNGEELLRAYPLSALDRAVRG